MSGNIKRIFLLFFLFLMTTGLGLAQDPAVSGQPGETTSPQQPAAEEEIVVEGEAISGGITYNPVKKAEEASLRDPFKSPFDLAREAAEARKQKARIDMSGRIEYNVTDLQLKGIYLEARSGYWAIFEIGGSKGKYEWFQAGSKFQDGDLVNVDDESVLFKQFIDDESQEMAHRELKFVLHRGEE
jgi:hypothetical protein